MQGVKPAEEASYHSAEGSGERFVECSQKSIKGQYRRQKGTIRGMQPESSGVSCLTEIGQLKEFQEMPGQIVVMETFTHEGKNSFT